MQNVCGNYTAPGCLQIVRKRCSCWGDGSNEGFVPDVGKWAVLLMKPDGDCPLGFWNDLPPDVARFDRELIGSVEVPVLVLNG